MTHPSNDYGTTPAVRIRDHGALSSVLRWLIATRGGTQGSLAARLGIDQSTISTLLNGRRRSMRFSTYARLLEELGGEAAKFGYKRDPVLGFGTEPNEPGGEQRQAEAEKRWEMYETFKRSVLARDQEYIQRNYQAWVEAELERIDDRVRSAFQELWNHTSYNRYFADLLEAITGRRELPDKQAKRLWLGLYRIVEPLVDWVPTLSVEPSWRELEEEGDLRRYLRSAAVAERILLGRSVPLLARAKELRAVSEMRRADEELALFELRASGELVEQDEDRAEGT